MNEAKHETKFHAMIRLLRVKHYIKNGLLFLPLFFGQGLFAREKLLAVSLGFFAFSFASSIVYILNDLRDVDRDRQHPTKKKRPLASGALTENMARVLLAVCLVLASAFSAVLTKLSGNGVGNILLIVYLILNIAYSYGLKNVPLVDIVILASGYVIRVYYGGAITGIEVSEWLCLVIITGSLFMGLCKRRNELMQQKFAENMEEKPTRGGASDYRIGISGEQGAGYETRKVLQYYTVPFLDKNMYVCAALTDAFYALWALGMGNRLMVWTVPLFILILMCYSLTIEGESDGDPVEVILHSRPLLILGVVYAVAVGVILYIF